MEHFPFEQVVGLIVFVIIVLAQFWTKLRAGKLAPPPDEHEPDHEFPEFGQPRPAPHPPQRPMGESPRPASKLDDVLREALGLPPEGKPQVPAPPRTQATLPPSPPRVPQPYREKAPVRPAPPPVLQSAEESVPTGSVMASLERLEQEASRVRQRVEQLGRLKVEAGTEAETRMRQRLAGLIKGLDLIESQTAAPKPGMSFVGSMLTDRKTVRRAIVLNEILGPPRGLNPYN